MPRPKDYDTQTDRRTARLFVIACEGEKTELSYFSALAEGLRRVRVEPLPGLDGLSAPEQVLERLNSYKADTPNSEFWLVIDVDRWFAPNRVAKTHKVLDEAARRGYGVAISNPCIEMWLLLHFQDGAAMNCNDCEAGLKNHLSYAKGFYDFEILRPLIPAAVRRARELDATTQGPTRPPDNPNSHIYRIIEAMHTACGPSLPFSL